MLGLLGRVRRRRRSVGKRFLGGRSALRPSCRLSRVCPCFGALCLLRLLVSIALLFVASGRLQLSGRLCCLEGVCRGALLLLLLWRA